MKVSQWQKNSELLPLNSMLYLLSFVLILLNILFADWVYASGIVSISWLDDIEPIFLFTIGLLILIPIVAFIQLIFKSKNKLKTFLYIIGIVIAGTILAIMITTLIAFLTVILWMMGADLFVVLVIGPISIPITIVILHKKMKPYFFPQTEDSKKISSLMTEEQEITQN